MAKEKQWGLKVTPKDDAIHLSDSPERWEWWYFDADFDNGYNKDTLARQILGSDQAVLANKQRLGIQ